MNKRILKKKVKQIIQSTMNDVNISLKIQQEQSGVNMSYDFIKNIVYFDAERIQKARMEVNENVSLEAYVKAVTLHELGHFLDREALQASIPRAFEIFKFKNRFSFKERIKHSELFKIDIEAHELNYVFEETAWENAEKLNRLFGVVDWESFEIVKFHCMLSYAAQYNRDLLIYQRLQTKEKSITAAV
ncbi:integrase [Pueribacillus theae]|uniref:Integrase n=1 Tax=Pueribacillus theae TaxID=2171751 RepID=A0A2U1JIL7_9BACI|nr:integrase [Pueribacillus theae]PWA04982.1 integrase [Pueribacillus theae]